MKKLLFLVFAALLCTFSVNAQSDDDVSYFCSPLYPKDTIHVGDTVLIGTPLGGLGEFSTIKKNLSDKVQKAKKGAKWARLLGEGAVAVGSVVGGMPGLNTMIKGIRVATTASTVEDVLGVTDELTNRTPSKRMIVTALYKAGKGLDEIIIAEAVNGKGTKFSIDLNAAFVTKELLPKNGEKD